MKTWKQRIFCPFMLVAIIALFNIIYPPECNGQDKADLRADFFNTWNVDKWWIDEGDRVLTINANSIAFNWVKIDLPDFYWKVSLNNWTLINNNDQNTKNVYNKGYYIRGTYLDHTSADVIGNEFSITLFMNTNKQSIIWIEDDEIYYCYKK
jgi:hypothetical protein